MRAASPKDWFGPPFLSLVCDIPAAGKYRVSIETIQGPEQAQVQLFQNEAPVGSPIDLYAPERTRGDLTAMGTLDLEDRETAELYLQRCLFDDTLSLDDMLADQRMGDHLRSCMDKTSGMWRFPQKAWLIFFGELAESIGDYRRR